MTTAYTSLLGLALPVTGELSGTWGDTVNNSITSLVDTAVAGTTNVSADSNVTLTTTTGASNQARQAILLFSGARTAIRTVTAPAQSKIYTVINATTGGFAVQLVGAGPTTGVTIANGARTVVAWNGSDFVEVSSPSSIILPGGTANGVLYLNGSKVVTSGSALVFDGTNLGIGTSSPASDARLTLASPTTESYVMFSRTNSGVFDAAVGNNGGSLVFKGGADSSTVAGLTEFMRLDSSGNLGLGVTPSAWGSNFKAIQVGSQAAFSTDSGVTADLVLNAHQSGSNWIYKANGNATLLRQESGVYKFFNAPSGTAGNAITFTQAMTLDASGRLGVGRTSVGAQLDVLGSASTSAMRIVGNSGASLYVDLSGGGDNYYDATNNIFRNASGTERARIDSSGNLLVGTTSNPVSDRLVVDKSISINSAGGAEPQINFNSSNASIEFVNRNSGGSKTFKWYYQASAAGSPATLSTSGVWTNASDIRGKENIIDIGYGLETVIALKPRKFDVKSDGSHAIGFIAQELLNTIPEVVHVTMTDKDGSNWYGVDYGAITSVLVKAIQEQQAIISAQSAVLESLKARLDAANL